MKKAVLILSWLLLAIPCRAEIIIVDDGGDGDFDNIQAAIDDSNDGDIIFVFPGTYTGIGNRNIDFGGRAITVTSVAPEDPYIVAITVIDCEGGGRGFYFNTGEDGNSVLDGLTITDGSADRGGAIRILTAGPTISNCIITGNTATSYGGGIDGGGGVIANCTITGNTATVDGGGVYMRPGLIVGCTISDNWAGQNGGGIAECSQVAACLISGNQAVERGGGLYNYNIESSAHIIACMFRGNSAAYGGGLYESWVDWIDVGVSISSCAFSGNYASIDGGGLYCDSCIAWVTNCTFSGNHAASAGGGLYNGLGLVNCVFWGNTDSTGAGEYAQISGSVGGVSYSCIQDDDPNDASIPFGGEDNGNIDDNPQFVRDPNDGGDGWGVGDNDDFGDLHLQSGSPCINAGHSFSEFKVWDWDPYQEVDVNVDIDGQPRIMGWIVDMGADEFYMPMIVVTRPSGGEVWSSGSWHQIKWESSTYEGTVDILLSTNGGGDWQSVDTGVVDTGNYGWDVPEAVDSNQCVISVVPSVADPNVVTVASGLFTIHPDTPGPPVASKWKSLGGDFDRIGRSDYSGPQLGCIKWEFEVDGAISGSVTIGPNDTVYVPCEDGNLYKLDANGSLLWTYEANSPLISSPTIGPDGTVYVGAKNGKLYAVDVDGNVRWTHSTDGMVYSSPAVSADGNSIYAGSQDGKLYALGRDGSELWSFETGAFGVIDGAIFASPAIGPNGTVYVAGLYDPNLYALDPNDGSIKWECNFPSEGWPFASPVIGADGTIYQVLLYDANLYAIDPNDGNTIWATNLSEITTEGNPEIQTQSYSRWFEPYYYEDGSCEPISEYYVYRNALYNVSSSGWSEPVLGPDGTIYVSFDDPWLRAVEPNGSIKWIRRPGTRSGYIQTDGYWGWGWYETNPGGMSGFSLTVDSNGLIYAASDDSNLYVVNPDGFEIARFDSNDYWLSFPVISADNTVVFSDSRDNSMLISYADNLVWAIGGNDCQGQDPNLYWQGSAQDLDCSGTIDFIDFSILASDWRKCTVCWPPMAGCWPVYEQFLTGDINKDLYVDFEDVAALADQWLRGY